MKIQLDFRFDSAHFLPLVPENHKCRSMHGHTYWATLTISGETDEKGWLMDFADIRDIAQPVITRIDHTLLNAVPGLENPTVENIAKYLYHEIQPKLQNLASIEVKETPFSRCIYSGE